MRICFLADGSHVNTRNWVRYFAGELGHDVLVISLETGCAPLAGVEIIEIETPKGLGKLKYLWAVARIRRAVKRCQPDILIGYRVSSYGFLAACCGFHPLVLAAQGYNIDNPEQSWLKERFIRFAIARADRYYAWGEHMGQCFQELGARQEKVRVCPRGVDVERFRLADYPAGELTMVMTRGLKPGYGLELPFHAMAELARRQVGFRFLVAGDGPLKEELQGLARRLGLADRVEFLGHVDNSRLPEVLGRAHVYLSPVPTDGVSASLLEAMACGLVPVVIDNVANRLWIEEGRNGYLVAADSVPAMAEALLRVAHAETPIEQMRQLNRAIVEERGAWKKNMQAMAADLGALAQAAAPAMAAGVKA